MQVSGWHGAAGKVVLGVRFGFLGSVRCVGLYEGGTEIRVRVRG